jgi:hypothetical protein
MQGIESRTILDCSKIVLKGLLGAFADNWFTNLKMANGSENLF